MRHVRLLITKTYKKEEGISCGICQHLSILFYLALSIINRTKKIYILNIWFVKGYKTCRKQSMELHQQMKFWHGTWFWKNVYSLWVNCFYGTLLLFDLHWCNILFNIAIFIILTNVYTFITVCFYVCRWKVKKKKTINTVNKTFLKITQVMEVALDRSDTSSSKEWWSLCLDIKARRCIFWNICEWNETFCLM